MFSCFVGPGTAVWDALGRQVGPGTAVLGPFERRVGSGPAEAGNGGIGKLALDACGVLVGVAQTTKKELPFVPRSEALNGNI